MASGSQSSRRVVWWCRRVETSQFVRAIAEGWDACLAAPAKGHHLPVQLVRFATWGLREGKIATHEKRAVRAGSDGHRACVLIHRVWTFRRGFLQVS